MSHGPRQDMLFSRVVATVVPESLVNFDIIVDSFGVEKLYRQGHGIPVFRLYFENGSEVGTIMDRESGAFEDGILDVLTEADTIRSRKGYWIEINF